jgi:hypothetical protein
MILKAGIDAEIQTQKELQPALDAEAAKRAKFNTMDRAVANAAENNKEEAQLQELERTQQIAEPSKAETRAQYVNPLFTRRARGRGRKTRRGGESDRAAIMKLLQPITEKTPVMPVGPGLVMPVPEKQQVVAELNTMDSAPPDIPDQPVGTPWKVTDPVTGKTTTGTVTAGRKSRKNKARKSTFRRHRK